jgi:hypothetical protein
MRSLSTVIGFIFFVATVFAPVIGVVLALDLLVGLVG